MSNYIVTKQTKSVGISILLTFLFGPIGLFYSTVIGGVVMTTIPVVLGAFFLISIFGENKSLLMTSFILLIFFGLFWWIIAIIWGAISVKAYNRRLLLGAVTIDMPNISVDQVYNQNLLKNSSTQQTSNDEDSAVVQWLKQNPHRGLNDYYKEFGNSTR